LGPLEVIVTGQPIVVDTRKALAIVALIAAEGRPFARDELTAMFWPEADGEDARGALRRTLSTLRAAVGGHGLVIGRAQVALDPGTKIDLVDLERLAASGTMADLEAAANLARGPFLAGFALRDSPAFDDWQATRAARVERAVGDVLERLAAARLASGDRAGAVEVGRRRVELDPLDEVGQRALIEMLARAGDRAGAIRQYRELVALFERELGVTPLRETTELYDAIREDRMPRRPGPTAAGPSSSTRNADRVPTSSPEGVPLVGREGELVAIRAAWEAARPDGRLVLIEGEAGIGKTRLAETIAGAIRDEGGAVLAARGYPGERAIAYGPIAELLRAGFAEADGEQRIETLDDTARREIARLVDLPGATRIPSATGLAWSDEASARVRLLDAVADALTAFATRSKPGLIWVDDLHLADDPSGEAIAYLARRLADRPVLVLLAWRREDLTRRGEGLVESLVGLPGATVLTLRRLALADVATIVRTVRPDDADDALIDALVSDSEGLPLHLVAALASGEPPGTSLPRGVHALLRERIVSVSETAAQVLSAAAVIGRSFDLGLVRQASGRSEEETVDAIEELMHRGIVREVPAASGPSAHYDFAHGRMRDVALELASLARRRLLHRRTAEALRFEPAGSGRDELARFARIASHEREAGRAAEAAAAFIEAADRAETIFANREAIEHLEASLALGSADPASAHARVGELRSRLGEYPAAIAALETAAALAGLDELPGIEIALGRVHRRRGDLDAAASHLQAVLALPGLADSTRALALVEESVVALRAGDLAMAGQAASAASVAADRAGDPHLSGVAERLIGLVARTEGDLESARAALQRSVILARDDPDPTASIAALTALALTHAADGAVDDAVDMATTAIEECRRMGDRHLEAAVENHIADLLHDAGRAEESMVHLKRAVALFAEIGEGALERDPGIWSLAAW